MLMPNFDNLEVELVRDNIYKILTDVTYESCISKRKDTSVGYTLLGDNSSHKAYFITEGIDYEQGCLMRELSAQLNIPNLGLCALSEAPSLGGCSIC